MPIEAKELKISVFSRLSDISEESWNLLSHGDFPFSSYRFLSSLEQTRCVGAGTGWIPVYITLLQGDSLVGATYLYEKEHSYGEYIFDWQWARAYQTYGVPYYPKLLSAVPFTPATGPKILVRSSDGSTDVRKQLLNATLGLMMSRGCQSFHALFIAENDVGIYRDAGLMIRHTFQYHWHNRGYGSFEDFLSSLKGTKRKNIVKERRVVREANIDIQVLSGTQITSEHAEVMYQFYVSTIEKMEGISYLNRQFFRDVFESMKENIVLCLAKKDGRWIAGALNFRVGQKLFGRYWGCLAEFQFLHFELCYYQTVEYAIAHKIQVFEAGAQGHHKLQRGFLPSITYSAHLLRDHRFHDAIAKFTEEEAKALSAEVESAKEHFPYK